MCSACCPNTAPPPLLTTTSSSRDLTHARPAHPTAHQEDHNPAATPEQADTTVRRPSVVHFACLPAAAAAADRSWSRAHAICNRHSLAGRLVPPVILRRLPHIFARILSEKSQFLTQCYVLRLHSASNPILISSLPPAPAPPHRSASSSSCPLPPLPPPPPEPSPLVAIALVGTWRAGDPAYLAPIRASAACPASSFYTSGPVSYRHTTPT